MTKVELTKAQKTKLSGIKTTSDKFRFLRGLRMDRGQIAKVTGKIYQHVRNVEVQDLAKTVAKTS